MLHIDIGDILEADFRQRCAEVGRPYGSVIRELVEAWLADKTESEVPKCPECGRPVYHTNLTMPYCSHRCAGLATVSVEDGARVVVFSGEPGTFNKGGARGVCFGCGRRYQDYFIGAAGSRDRYCLGCVVLVNYDYNQVLVPPSDPKELLEYVKRGGVLRERT